MRQTDAAPPGRPPVVARVTHSGTFSSLSLGQCRLLLAGTGAAQVANWMEMLTRGWLVQDLTPSPFHLGLIAFVSGISSLIASPAAGVVTDRIDRRTLAVSTQLISAAIALMVGVLVVSGQIELWQLYIMAIVSGVSAAVNMPARQVLLYDVVGGENLTNAIALNSVTANVARIGAPTFGGGIIAAAGIGPAYFTQVAFMLLATAATLTLRVTNVAQRAHIPMWQG